MSPGEGDGDARRTGLAGERTLLAWWRTGLTAIAVALAVGRLLPDLAPDATRWPFATLGAAFALYGICFFLFGTLRLRAFDRGLGAPTVASGEFGSMLLFMAAGVLLGLGALAVIVIQ